jgi:hypothetical protein
MYGSTLSSHFKALSNLSGTPLCGTLIVYPTIPWTPEGTPVPNDVRLVDVVDGNVALRIS